MQGLLKLIFSLQKTKKTYQMHDSDMHTLKKMKVPVKGFCFNTVEEPYLAFQKNLYKPLKS